MPGPGLLGLLRRAAGAHGRAAGIRLAGLTGGGLCLLAALGFLVAALYMAVADHLPDWAAALVCAAVFAALGGLLVWIGERRARMAELQAKVAEETLRTTALQSLLGTGLGLLGRAPGTTAVAGLLAGLLVGTLRGSRRRRSRAARKD